MAKKTKSNKSKAGMEYKQSITYDQHTLDMMKDFMDEIHTNKLSPAIRHIVAYAHEQKFSKKKKHYLDL